MYKYFFKPLFDFALSLLGFILISPIFLLLWLLLTVANKGAGAFFTQARPGRNEKIFKVIKFKTMTDERDSEGELLPDAARLTKVGKFVRSTSLDEIPQLLNVLKGDMSLIGPRPLLPEYLEFYSKYHRRRHELRPGITGLAQVKGRNNMKFSERFYNDIYYIDNLTIFLDCKIIIMTLLSIFTKRSDVVLGQTVEEVDDLGISRNLSKNHFKKDEK